MERVLRFVRTHLANGVKQQWSVEPMVRLKPSRRYKLAPNCTNHRRLRSFRRRTTLLLFVEKGCMAEQTRHLLNRGYQQEPAGCSEQNEDVPSRLKTSLSPRNVALESSFSTISEHIKSLKTCLHGESVKGGSVSSRRLSIATVTYSTVSVPGGGRRAPAPRTGVASGAREG
eukprot:scaffold1934_cov217-Pinguiococcus_pyrenoidosus.AAC.2